ncbi:MAG: crossover junction endodeoxyribonuclease RuvC [Bacteroidetes bacterium]|nr:crossover junction endodeoxyribonuclease RuvC [Bacteroidota bacterium]HET6243489.1 crossover junction endodeoxyribonuclease RuvC [Bacteroidia bacterium]
MNSDRIILGIDPGTNIMGYGVIHIKQKKMELLSLGTINMSKIDDHHIKLKNIFESTVQLIELYKPDDMAIEAPFFGKNVQSMLKLGRAQGVAIAAALHRNIPITEYAPKKIKQSITGNGNASKEQVSAMLQSLLVFQNIPNSLDATDGLAAAVCHYFQKNSAGEKKVYSGWESFIVANPKRKIN